MPIIANAAVKSRVDDGFMILVMVLQAEINKLF